MPRTHASLRFLRFFAASPSLPGRRRVALFAFAGLRYNPALVGNPLRMDAQGPSRMDTPLPSRPRLPRWLRVGVLVGLILLVQGTLAYLLTWIDPATTPAFVQIRI